MIRGIEFDGLNSGVCVTVFGYLILIGRENPTRIDEFF
jgi:hypothetical protein